MTRQQKRFERQFMMLERKFPALRGPIRVVLQHRWRLVRVPLAILLIIGSVFAILPIFGLWMLPLGLLLLAVDVPALQPWVSAMVIRARRALSGWSRRRNRRK